MLTTNDLSQIYELFGYGLMIGGLASGIVWAIAFTIKAFLSWINQAS